MINSKQKLLRGKHPKSDSTGKEIALSKAQVAIQICDAFWSIRKWLIELGTRKEWDYFRSCREEMRENGRMRLAKEFIFMTQK